MGKIELYSVKHEITNALITLMKERSYMDITVTDIIKEANVARASFYRNFDSVSDVIDAITDHMTESFTEHIYPALNSKDSRKTREFLFNYLYRLTDSKNNITSIDPQNMSVILARIDAGMKYRELDNAADSIKDKYTAFAKFGLINSVVKRWMNDGMKETPEEIIDYIMSCISLF